MATGTVKWFAQALEDLGKKVHNLSADTLKLGIIDNTVAPTLATADPRWGAGGSTDFSAHQVSTSGTSYTGPVTLTTVTWTLVANVPTLRADNVVLAQDVTGFTNGAYGIIYNDTSAGKQCVGYVELSAAGGISLVTGSLTIDWNGATNDILTITQS